jgi:hypothetical protein
MRQILRCAGVGGIIVMLAGCTYRAELERLTPEERTAFYAYNKVMTPRQAHTYLTKATTAERAAYLEEIGLAQRFQALDPEDRATVLAGFPKEGMSGEALRFLWGRPLYERGNPGHYEYWYYWGSAFSLGEHGTSHTEVGSQVTVYLTDGRVVWWRETVPTEPGDEDSKSDRRG